MSGTTGNYADTALRQSIEQGWIPGPTIIPSGLIISTTGGQFTPTPEMYKGHNIVYPEYLEANSRDEIVKAVRENLLFGAKVIKICLDCKPWGYSVDDIKLFIAEAAKGGAKVNAHVQTRDGGAAGDRRRPPRHLARPAAHARAARADGAEDASTWRAPTRRSRPITARRRGSSTPPTSSSRRGRRACRSPSRPTWTTGASSSRTPKASG